ncbi:hypothetical protein [Brevibacillus borstelensis]|uniref:hypothetical protein n=1 Tax=Brevibacillus borstelensis TaxID=45462 RepID=UPI0030BBE010
MSQARAMFLICIAGIMMVFAFLGLWESYQPRVGPVGNGPNYQWTWTWFILQLFNSGCFLTLGINGLYTSRKKEQEKYAQTKTA